MLLEAYKGKISILSNFVPIQSDWDSALGREPVNMLSVAAEGNVQLQHISWAIGMQPLEDSVRQKAHNVVFETEPW